MEYDKELDFLISQALLEVERDLSLPNNSLVDATPLPNISKEVKLKELEVRLDQDFMARVPEKLIKHSKELVLRKRVAEKEEAITLLTNALNLLLEQYVKHRKHKRLF